MLNSSYCTVYTYLSCDFIFDLGANHRIYLYLGFSHPYGNTCEGRKVPPLHGALAIKPNSLPKPSMVPSSNDGSWPCWGWIMTID